MGCFPSSQPSDGVRSIRPSGRNPAVATEQMRTEAEKRKIDEEKKDRMRVKILQKKNKNVPSLRIEQHPLYKNRVQ